MDAAGFDILLPYWGQYLHVRECLESIIYCTPKQTPYKITLIDDGSPNKDFYRVMTKAPRTAGVQLPEQRGFAGAVQAGLEKTSAPWVVVIHSDCVIKERGWLQSLYKSILELRKDKVWLISSLTDDPPNGCELVQADRMNRESVDRIVDEPLPLFCCLFPRKLIEKTKGFLKPYPYGWYEDQEFYWRMRKFGLKQGVCGGSWVHHKGGMTVKNLWKAEPETKAVMTEQNRQRCAQDIKALYATV